MASYMVPFAINSMLPTAVAKSLVAVVEDESVLRDELAFQLEHLGFAVETFEGATQLYRRLAVQKFAVLILDISLGGEDGLSICQHIRQHDKSTGIVFVSARSLRNDRLEGLSAGADAYFVKPIDLQEFAFVVQRLAERHHSWIDGFKSVRVAPEEEANAWWELDRQAASLKAPGGASVSLTLNEARLLRALFAKRNEVCTHRELGFALGLHSDEFDKHRLEVILSRLRAKVLRRAGRELPVQVLRGAGYRLVNMREASESL